MAYIPSIYNDVNLEFKDYTPQLYNDINLKFNEGDANQIQSIVSEEAFGTATFYIEANPTGIVSEEEFGSAEFVDLLLFSIGSEEEFGSTILGNLEFYPTGLATEEAFGDAFVGEVLYLTGINTEEDFGQSKFTLFIEPDSVNLGEIFGTTEVFMPVDPLAILSEEDFGTSVIVNLLRGVQNLQSPLGAMDTGFYPTGFGIVSTQLYLYSCSDSYSDIQIFKGQLLDGDPFDGLWKYPTAAGITSIQNLATCLDESVTSIQSLLTDLNEDPIHSIQVVKETIDGVTPTVGLQQCSLRFQDTQTSYLSVDYDIILDGVSIKDRITAAEIIITQRSIHNSFRIQSTDMQLFVQSDPRLEYGTTRISIIIGSRTLNFLLEDRSGKEYDFSIWGRSESALEDKPFAEEVSIALSEPTSAASVVHQMINTISIDWQCADWIIPAGFSFVGIPLEGVQRIAKQIGAVIRCLDNGTLVVRQKYQIRPINLSVEAPGVDYDRESNLIEFGIREDAGCQCNRITVIGYSGDVQTPDMEVEESCIAEGETCHVRAYWSNGLLPKTSPSVFLTDGAFTDEGLFTEEIIEEVVEFKDGEAVVSKPISKLELTDVAWIGSLGGVVSWIANTKNLSILNEAFRLAYIKYTTTYRRYTLYGHDVTALMQVLTIPADVDILVELVQSPGDKTASDLKAAWLSTESIATVAGTAWLDDNKYTKYVIAASAPYNSIAIDGMIAGIDDDVLSITGNCYLIEASIIISGAKVTNKLEFVQCQI